MTEHEKKQLEELANAGGIELTDEQIDDAAGGASDLWIHCPRCDSTNLEFYAGKQQYQCKSCKTWFTFDMWERTTTIVKSGGCG